MDVGASLAFDDADAVAKLYIYFIAPWLCPQETNSTYLKRAYMS